MCPPPCVKAAPLGLQEPSEGLGRAYAPLERRPSSAPQAAQKRSVFTRFDDQEREQGRGQGHEDEQQHSWSKMPSTLSPRTAPRRPRRTI